MGKKRTQHEHDDDPVPHGATGASVMRVGTAGWAVPSAVSNHFPGEGTHLERYARVFSCVEINSSFYRSHQIKTYTRWAESVPEAFRFSVKMPRTITHELGLRDCDEPLQTFLTEISALGSKLGCILIQLPPSFAFDARVVAPFMALLKTQTKVSVVCEPRHASWFTSEAASALREARVSRVWADPSPVAGISGAGDGDLFYARLHGAPVIYQSAYDDAFLHDVASRMRREHEHGKAAWCIFDNTARGEAVPNALTLSSLLGAV